jgi:hypothetical protein
MLARLAGIDGAARELAGGSVHATSGGGAARCGMALTPVCAPGLPGLPAWISAPLAPPVPAARMFSPMAVRTC